MTRKVHRDDRQHCRDLGAKFRISLVTGTSDLRSYNKRAHNAYTRYRQNHVVSTHFPCPNGVPITSIYYTNISSIASRHRGLAVGPHLPSTVTMQLYRTTSSPVLCSLLATDVDGCNDNNGDCQRLAAHMCKYMSHTNEFTLPVTYDTEMAQHATCKHHHHTATPKAQAHTAMRTV